MKRIVYIMLAALLITALLAGCGTGNTKNPIDGELKELLNGAAPTETPENCDAFEGVLWGAAADELLEEAPIEIIRRGVSVAGNRGDAYFTFDKDGGLIRGVYIFNESRSLPWNEALKVFLAIRNELESEYGAPGESSGSVSEPSSLEEIIEAGSGSWSAIWNGLKSSDGRRVAATLTIEWHGEIWLAFHCIDSSPLQPKATDDTADSGHTAKETPDIDKAPVNQKNDYGRKAESVRIVSKDASVIATEFEPTAGIEMIAGADLDVLNIRRVDGCPFRIYSGEKELFGVYHLYDAETLVELDFFHPSGPEPQFFIFSDAAPGREYIVTLLTEDNEKDTEVFYAFRAALAEDFPIYPEPPAQEFLSFISPESIEVYVSPVFEKLYPTDIADDPLTLEDYLCYICGPDAWEFTYNGPGLENYPEAVIEVHDSDGRTLSIMSDAPALLIVESDGSLTWAWHADGDIDCADLILRLLPWARGEYTGLG